ncbi:FtsX-like permease family protein [Actinoplanes sp. NPDC051411]|uniref:ABC transporter permease n=1 Tax=Actinoplanes sp. NPDC051411 TaxID=3155522 RepID=UPI003443C731
MSLAWPMVRHRFAAFAGTFIAIAFGVAVVAGATTVYLSSQPQAPARYDQAPVLVRSPSIGDNEDGLPEYESWSATEAATLAERLGAVKGVRDAVADPAFYVQRVSDGHAVGDPEASRIDGHTWSSAALGGYRLMTGVAPEHDGEVAVAGMAPGDELSVITSAGTATWRVTGTTDGPGFYVADQSAARMSAGVRVIGLTVTGDPAQIAEAARSVVGAHGAVLTGSTRDKLEPEEITRVRWLGAQLLIVMVALGVFVTVFVVASTCALTAAQRRREIGLLRSVGATPGQVQRLMYAEVAVVAVLGGLVGVSLGALTAPLLAGPLVDTGLEPTGFTVHAQPLALAGAFLLGLAVALLGVAVVARRASRTPALDALREAAGERRSMTLLRWIAGIGATAGGVALLATLPSMPIGVRSTAGLGGAMLLLTGAAFLSPVVIVPLVRVVTWPWRRAATGMLVREGTLVAVRRVASTAAPVLLTVGFTVLLTGTVATISKVEGLDEKAKIPAATVLAPDGTPGLSAAAVEAQRGTARLSTRVLVAAGGTVAGHDAAGITGRRGLTLDRDTARKLHASAGTALRIRMTDGTESTIKVTAVKADAGADLVLPWETVRRHDPGALADYAVLDGPPVGAAGARAMSAQDYVQEGLDDENQLIDLFLVVMIGLGVGYTGLAIANTLLMATSARRPEFQALRLAGATTGQVLRVTTVEALVSVAVGTALGAVVAAISLNGVRAAVAAELHRAVEIVVPWSSAVTVTVACALVAVAATATPVLRRR